MAGPDEQAERSGEVKHTADELLDAFHAGFDVALGRVSDFLSNDGQDRPTPEEISKFVHDLLGIGKGRAE